jgi:RNA polymerase sigma-70 factor (ECF subfamily)
MVAQHHKNDYSIARQICKDLRADHKEAILALYHEHHHFFLAFTRRRIYHSEPDQIDTVLSNFWTELLNSKAICSYAGKAALRTFLLTILNRRIIDANRKFQREMKYTEVIANQEGNMPGISDNAESAEDLLLQKERQKVVHDTLALLSENAPKDAALIRMRLNGLSYKKMAQQELTASNNAAPELQKKVDSIKKQFTRPLTGSLAKYRALLEENLREKGINPEDLLNRS